MGLTRFDLPAPTRKPIHLVLTDVVMPEMNGPELAEWFRTIGPGRPRLVHVRLFWRERPAWRAARRRRFYRQALHQGNPRAQDSDCPRSGIPRRTARRGQRISMNGNCSAGIVLCGGASRRMGRGKADLTIANETLLGRSGPCRVRHRKSGHRRGRCRTGITASAR